MKFLDFLYLIYQSFKNRKSRIILTVLGVSIGIGATLFLVSLGYGLQQALFARIATDESLLTLDIVPAEPEIVRLNQQTIKEIALIPNVAKVSPKAVLPGQVTYDELISEIALNIVNPDFFVLGGIIPDLGEVFTEQDQRKVVINSSIAELFNLEPEEFLGKELSFVVFLPKEVNGEIVGVELFEPNQKFKVKGVILEMGAPPQIYLNKRDAPELPIKEYQFAKVMIAKDKYIEQAREQLIGRGFIVSALVDVIAQATQIFRVIQIVLGIFGIIALLVAAIGLANTMTISLLQRTSDIGIMRAIGVSPQDIKKMFLTESLVIGFLGGVVGILVGIFSGEIFNFGLNTLAILLGGQPVDIFYYPGWFILFIIFLSSLVGLIAGYWPAKRAEKLNPLEALRYK